MSFLFISVFRVLDCDSSLLIFDGFTLPQYLSEFRDSIFPRLSSKIFPQKRGSRFRNCPLSLDSKIQNHRIKLSCILNARVQHKFREFFVHRQYLFLDDIRSEGKCLVRKNFIVSGMKTELLYPSIPFQYTRCDLLRRKVILNIEVCSFSAITPSVLFHIKFHSNRKSVL